MKKEYPLLNEIPTTQHYGMPQEKYIGNRTLLYSTLTAFFSSKDVYLPTLAAIKKWANSLTEQDCVICGFQSRGEKTLLKVLLSTNVKIICVLATELPSACPLKYKNAINEGRMLMLSFCNDCEKRLSRDSARKRNQYILERAHHIVVGDLTYGGMIEQLLEGKEYRMLGKKHAPRIKK